MLERLGTDIILCISEFLTLKDMESFALSFSMSKTHTCNEGKEGKEGKECKEYNMGYNINGDINDDINGDDKRYGMVILQSPQRIGRVLRYLKKCQHILEYHQENIKKGYVCRRLHDQHIPYSLIIKELEDFKTSSKLLFCFPDVHFKNF
jgi:hypothetical protein